MGTNSNTLMRLNPCILCILAFDCICAAYYVYKVMTKASVM